jgi:hypothetical protein
MRTVVILSMAVLLIGFVVVGMYEYTQATNLDKWGTFEPLMTLSPILAAAALGVGGTLIFAFARGRRR